MLKMDFFGASIPGLLLAKCSVEKTKHIDMSQPPHQGDELKRHKIGAKRTLNDAKLTLNDAKPTLTDVQALNRL